MRILWTVDHLDFCAQYSTCCLCLFPSLTNGNSPWDNPAHKWLYRQREQIPVFAIWIETLILATCRRGQPFSPKTAGRQKAEDAHWKDSPSFSPETSVPLPAASPDAVMQERLGEHGMAKPRSGPAF
jgi:hypothetical protein